MPTPNSNTFGHAETPKETPNSLEMSKGLRFQIVLGYWTSNQTHQLWVATNDATPIKQSSSTAIQKRTWKMEEVALAFYLGLYLEGETTYFYLYSGFTYVFLGAI